MIKQHDCNVFDPYQDMAELNFFPLLPLREQSQFFRKKWSGLLIGLAWSSGLTFLFNNAEADGLGPALRTQ